MIDIVKTTDGNIYICPYYIDDLGETIYLTKKGIEITMEEFENMVDKVNGGKL